MSMVKFRRLFYDVETSPNVGFFWRTGHNLTLDHDNIIEERKLICISWKWHDERKVHSVDWGKDKDDKKVLEAFLPILSEASQIVAHNGDRFDIKWIRGRCLVHRLNCPDVDTFDPLKAARAKFNLNCFRLDYISKLLGYPGKMNTGGFDLWKQVYFGNEKALRKMVKYCEADVRRLEEIYNDMESYVKPKMHRGVLEGGPAWSCPACGSKDVISNGPTTSAAGTTKYKIHCKTCGVYYRISNTLRKLMKEHKGDWND